MRRGWGGGELGGGELGGGERHSKGPSSLSFLPLHTHKHGGVPRIQEQALKPSGAGAPRGLNHPPAAASQKNRSRLAKKSIDNLLLVSSLLSSTTCAVNCLTISSERAISCLSPRLHTDVPLACHQFFSRIELFKGDASHNRKSFPSLFPLCFFFFLFFFSDIKGCTLQVQWPHGRPK